MDSQIQSLGEKKEMGDIFLKRGESVLRYVYITLPSTLASSTLTSTLASSHTSIIFHFKNNLNMGGGGSCSTAHTGYGEQWISFGEGESVGAQKAYYSYAPNGGEKDCGKDGRGCLSGAVRRAGRKVVRPLYICIPVLLYGVKYCQDAS